MRKTRTARASKWSSAASNDPTPGPFDLTGHPAITVPRNLSDGLPVEAMLVGKEWEEAKILLRAARSFEGTCDAHPERTRAASFSRAWRRP